jgi:copper chaperone CopZ
MSGSVLAESVHVDHVHLCCGKCEKAASAALQGINGISDVKVDRDEEVIRFEAADTAAANQALTALADAGFYGQPSVPGPDFKIDPKAASNKIQITGVHLCCKGCTQAAEQALEGVPGVKSVQTQAKQGTITVTGSEVNLAATLKALHEAGFHGKVN